MKKEIKKKVTRKEENITLGVENRKRDMIKGDFFSDLSLYIKNSY